MEGNDVNLSIAEGVHLVYKKRTQGWMKHADFILLDLLSLHIAFILAYFARNGVGNWPYGIQEYRMIVEVRNIIGKLHIEKAARYFKICTVCTKIPFSLLRMQYQTVLRGEVLAGSRVRGMSQ